MTSLQHRITTHAIKITYALDAKRYILSVGFLTVILSGAKDLGSGWGYDFPFRSPLPRWERNKVRVKMKIITQTGEKESLCRYTLTAAGNAARNSSPSAP